MIKTDTIVFDWGNTIMKDFKMEGPMVDWPQVEALEGADQILSTLKRDYRLILASNAQQSSAEQIRKALTRVDLDQYFDHIFTFHELGYLKPQIEFFTSLQSRIVGQSNAMMMVGDDYQKDILPAFQAGWRTVWFNPENKMAAAHLPLHHIEIDHLKKLPEAIQKPLLPSYSVCLDWYLQQGATHTLLAHVNLVAAAAYQMALWLKKGGEEVNPLLAHRGGLLHDLAKLTEKEGQNHAIGAYKLLMKKGQPALALIARRHLMGDLKSPTDRPQTWEEKLVHYADKLAEGSDLVSLKVRLAALQNRYPRFAEKIASNYPHVQALEDEICQRLKMKPGELLNALQAALFNGSD